MEFLIRLTAVVLFLGGPIVAHAQDETPAAAVVDIHKKERDEAMKRLCNSTDEFVKTLKFLRETKDFTFHEDVSRRIAEEVSARCDGAAERFSKILVLMKTVGLTEKKALKMAMEFAAASPDTQKNFVEIFNQAYLAEFFDYELPRAMKLAFDLSTDYKGDPAIARADFIALAKFCKSSEKLDLPIHFCAEYAEKIAKLSQYFASGVAQPFISLYTDLRDKKDFSFDIKDSLRLTYDILSHGPKAPENFYSGYKFATTDLAMDQKSAIEFSVKMAARSHIDEKPPILQFAYPTPNLPISAP